MLLLACDHSNSLGRSEHTEQARVGSVHLYDRTTIPLLRGCLQTSPAPVLFYQLITLLPRKVYALDFTHSRSLKGLNIKEQKSNFLSEKKEY